MILERSWFKMTVFSSICILLFFVGFMFLHKVTTSEKIQIPQQVEVSVIDTTQLPVNDAYSPELSYYLAADFGLPQGKCIKFIPDEIDDEYEGLYIIEIQDTNGHISVNEVTEKTWLALSKGDILK